MINNLLQKLIPHWDFLKGLPPKFSLQARIYHSLCIATILVVLANIPFSISVGLYKMALLSALLFVLQCLFYYLSRFRGRLYLSMVAYAVVIQLFFTFSFFCSSGIQGATLYSMIITYFLIIAIARRRYYLYWTLVHGLLVIGLIIYEYYHPEIVHSRYFSRSDQYLDIAFTYLVSMLLILACLTYIINNYTLEREICKEKAQALEKLNNEKNKLISIISHDFRTPLLDIKGYLALMFEGSLDSGERQQLERSVFRSVDDTERLLDNLLTWTKRHLKGKANEMLCFDLLECIGDTLDAFRRPMVEKNIAYVVALPQDVLVLANPELIRLMVRKFINNALKFTLKGGKITVDAMLTSNSCMLRISDNGIGIGKQAQEKIFTLAIDSTYGTKGESGVGLGLALCKEFADEQGIVLDFRSEENIGTTFTLSIPLA